MKNSHLDNLEEKLCHLDCRGENPISAKEHEVTGKDAQSRDVIQGTLEMLIMKTLALEAMHGYGIALRIEQISRGVFRVNPGSLLPALSRMERAGRVKSEWRATENNRRAKYYLLTPKGHKAFANETAQWKRQTDAIARILEA